jgi:hypothetical protein
MSDTTTSEQLRFTDEAEADEFGMLHERFAFALRAYGLKDGPLLDHALAAAVRAVWPLLKRDVQGRDAVRANLKVVQ